MAFGVGRGRNGSPRDDEPRAADHRGRRETRDPRRDRRRHAPRLRRASGRLAVSALNPLLDVQHLTVTFGGSPSVTCAVDDVSFQILPGETLGLVGESGSGKSVTAFSILRLLQPPGRITGGRVIFKGRDLLALPEREMREVRGARISLIFQEPMTALNPVMRVGDQIAEALTVHGKATHAQARARAVELLDAVRIPDAARRIRDYPHQLSGGMRQRVMIAIALACEPPLIIADEPTTALDVTIQAQVLDLMRELKTRYNLALLLITHDFGVSACGWLAATCRSSSRIHIPRSTRVCASATSSRSRWSFTNSAQSPSGVHASRSCFSLSGWNRRISRGIPTSSAAGSDSASGLSALLRRIRRSSSP